MKKIISILLIAFTLAGSAIAETQPCDSATQEQLLKTAARYRYGVKRDPNPEKAASIYKHLARIGNIKAMEELGRMYLTGDGVKKDYKCAYRLFKRAADNGNNKAKCDLALIYQKGLGCDIDLEQAYIQYLDATQNEYPQGYYGVGNLLYKGLGVKQDYKEAVKYLKKGSDLHHPGCSFLLASYYANGFNGDEDMALAEIYFNRASNDGHGWTVDITKNEVLESIKKRKEKHGSWKRVKDGTIKATEIPNSEEQISQQLILGAWEGYCYAYDWSRKNIINEIPIIVEIDAISNGIHIELWDSDTLITCSDLEEAENGYRYKNFENETSDYPWVITGTKLSNNNNRLLIEIESWNQSTREYRKPMLAVLDNKENDSLEGSSFFITGIKTKGKGKLAISINATTDMNVHVYICSVDGALSFSLGNFFLHEGENTIEVNNTHGFNMGTIVVDNEGERHSSNITVNQHG